MQQVILAEALADWLKKSSCANFNPNQILVVPFRVLLPRFTTLAALLPRSFDAARPTPGRLRRRLRREPVMALLWRRSGQHIYFLTVLPAGLIAAEDTPP